MAVRHGILGGAFGLLLLLAPAASSAQTAGSVMLPPAETAQLTLSGRIAHPQTITAAELVSLPATTVEVNYETGHGPQHGVFTGALLWTLIDGAGLVDEPGGKAHLQHTIVARGRDGYAVALAVGELDPGFEGKPVIVAYDQDGTPTPGLRLIVPNDKRAGRSVRDLVAIEVR